MRISDWSSDVCSSDLPGLSPAARALVELGIHHEQQHQELLLTDIQHLFAQNPLGPAVWPVDETAFASEVARFSAGFPSAPDPAAAMRWVRGAEGAVVIGHAGDGFDFDCEDRKRVGHECVSTGRSRWSPDH